MTNRPSQVYALKIPSYKLAKRMGAKAGAGIKTNFIDLREIMALKRFKDLMKKNAGKLSFSSHAR